MPFVQVDDLKIHYEVTGHGAPLLLLHGMSNNAQSWATLRLGLEEHFTVIAWDAPGYGSSSDPKEEFHHFKQFADVLKGFIEALGYDSVYLLGHSMGAAIAIELSCAYPHLVKALILADATRGAAALSPEVNEQRLQGRLTSIETMSPSEIASKRVHALLSPNASPEVRQRAEAIMSQVRPKGYKSVAYSLYNAQQMELLPHIVAPTLIICGELDGITPVQDSDFIHSLIPGSQLRIVPATGHLCYQEDPDTFSQFILDFLT